jgi:hypothetical protein
MGSVGDANHLTGVWRGDTRVVTTAAGDLVRDHLARRFGSSTVPGTLGGRRTRGRRSHRPGIDTRGLIKHVRGRTAPPCRHCSLETAACAAWYGCVIKAQFCMPAAHKMHAEILRRNRQKICAHSARDPTVRVSCKWGIEVEKFACRGLVCTRGSWWSSRGMGQRNNVFHHPVINNS